MEADVRVLKCPRVQPFTKCIFIITAFFYHWVCNLIENSILLSISLTTFTMSDDSNLFYLKQVLYIVYCATVLFTSFE